METRPGVQAGEEFCCFRSAREVQIIIAPLLAAGQQDVAAGWDGEGDRRRSPDCPPCLTATCNGFWTICCVSADMFP